MSFSIFEGKGLTFFAIAFWFMKMLRTRGCKDLNVYGYCADTVAFMDRSGVQVFGLYTGQIFNQSPHRFAGLGLDGAIGG